MQPDSSLSADSPLHRFLKLPLAVRWALFAWLVVLLVVGIKAVGWPRSRSLYATWATAGSDWVSGKDVYRNDQDPDLDMYRYGPPVAALMAPLAFVPERLGGLLWRLLNAGVYTSCFFWWLKRAAPRAISLRQLGLLFLLILPLAMGSLSNAQPNPLLAGLMLGGIACVASRRWNLASLLLAAAILLKLYPLALALLLGVLYPRQLLPRLAISLLLLLLIPFLLQEPSYVSRQYHLWWVDRLQSGDEARRFLPAPDAYRDLWLLSRNCHLPLPLGAYHALQAVTALACAGLTFLAGRRWGPTRPVLLLVWTLGSCWMMLFGPATESSTYVLLAPSLAWCLLEAWERDWPRLPRLALTAAGVLLLLTILASLFPWARDFHGLGPHPLAALLFAAGYLMVSLQAPLAEVPIPDSGPAPGYPKIYLGPDDRAA